MATYLFRFLNHYSKKPTGWIGVASASSADDLFWTIDEFGDPESCEIVQVVDGGICVNEKRRDIEVSSTFEEIPSEDWTSDWSNLSFDDDEDEGGGQSTLEFNIEAMQEEDKVIDFFEKTEKQATEDEFFKSWMEYRESVRKERTGG